MAGLCQAGDEMPQLRNGVMVARSASQEVLGNLNERHEFEAHNSHFFFVKFTTTIMKNNKNERSIYHMGVIGMKWKKRILPERLGVGITKSGRTVMIHWTKTTENGTVTYVGKVK